MYQRILRIYMMYENPLHALSRRMSDINMFAFEQRNAQRVNALC